MSAPVTLRGITWNHSRGYSPMAATAQRFSDLHPAINIVWEKHSLKTFEDSPVEKLAGAYDLLVLDHPCVRKAAPSGALVPLDRHLPAEFLADQAAQAVGRSNTSYVADGHQWGLAIDAAAPVAFWRSDLLERLGLPVPRTWAETLALARRGHVEVPAAPINCLMNFYTFCLAAGEEPFTRADSGGMISAGAGLEALGQLRDLLAACDPQCWSRTPIGSLDVVASAANTRLAYCPLSYGYSNYARVGFADHRIDFGETPLVGGVPLRTTLGGAGLSVSARRAHQREALAYAEFVASALVQRTLYTESGGQPGHRSAWLDADCNHLTGDYFLRTLPVLDRAYLRPHFPAYLRLQDQGSLLIHAALRGELPDAEALNRLNALYRECHPYPTP